MGVKRGKTPEKREKVKGISLYVGTLSALNCDGGRTNMLFTIISQILEFFKNIQKNVEKKKLRNGGAT